MYFWKNKNSVIGIMAAMVEAAMTTPNLLEYAFLNDLIICIT